MSGHTGRTGQPPPLSSNWRFEPRHLDQGRCFEMAMERTFMAAVDQSNTDYFFENTLQGGFSMAYLPLLEVTRR